MSSEQQARDLLKEMGMLFDGAEGPRDPQTMSAGEVVALANLMHAHNYLIRAGRQAWSVLDECEEAKRYGRDAAYAPSAKEIGDARRAMFDALKVAGVDPFGTIAGTEPGNAGESRGTE